MPVGRERGRIARRVRAVRIRDQPVGRDRRPEGPRAGLRLAGPHPQVADQQRRGRVRQPHAAVAGRGADQAAARFPIATFDVEPAAVRPAQARQAQPQPPRRVRRPPPAAAAAAGTGGGAAGTGPSAKEEADLRLRPHRHGPHRHGPHRHGPHRHGPHRHGPHRHGPHRHGPHRHGPHGGRRRRPSKLGTPAAGRAASGSDRRAGAARSGRRAGSRSPGPVPGPAGVRTKPTAAGRTAGRTAGGPAVDRGGRTAPLDRMDCSTRPVVTTGPASFPPRLKLLCQRAPASAASGTPRCMPAACTADQSTRFPDRHRESDRVGRSRRSDPPGAGRKWAPR